MNGTRCCDRATIIVQLDSAVQAGLAELDEAGQQPVSDVAADIISMHIDGENWEREKILEGLADFEAGRSVSQERVVAWLESWGTENELPVRECE